ncbi:hypothetical protein [Niveispirillum sp. SYP-B3756]|uniref:hypothetical protein n=1 Tax=Niveispirillum sp. SYP-B3756 TaxID=2662178 RepID=UPI001B3BACFB|nr:hypothetical protein [Niveispirillum sp. SYP-B3756]
MTPTATKKGSRLYRYYASMDVIRGRFIDPDSGAPLRLPAEMVENAVIREVRRLVRMPEIVAQTLAAARSEAPDLTAGEVVAALDRFDEIWSALFVAEQARLVRLLVDRVTVTADGIIVDLRSAGLGTLVRNLLTPRSLESVA